MLTLGSIAIHAGLCGLFYLSTLKKMVEFIFTTQFAVGQFHLKINGVEQTVSHLTGFSDESKQRLFEKTRQILDENHIGAGIDIQAEWKKICPYF